MDLNLAVSILVNADDPQAIQAFEFLVRKLNATAVQGAKRQTQATGAVFAQAAKRQAAAAKVASAQQTQQIKTAGHAQVQQTTVQQRLMLASVNKFYKSKERIEREAQVGARVRERSAALAQAADTLQANREQTIKTKAALELRNAIIKGALRAMTATVRAGYHALNAGISGIFNAGTSLIRNHMEKRREAQRLKQAEINNDTSRQLHMQNGMIVQAYARDNAHIQIAMSQQVQTIRTKLGDENTVYSQAAQRRLRTIQRTSATETRVVSEAAVRQANASARAQRIRSTGVIGAATGQSQLGSTLRNLTALAGGTLILRNIFQEATEAQVTLKQTAAVIKSTGGIAHVSAKGLDAYANQLSLISGVDDELIAHAGNVLLTFTNVRNEVGKGNDIFDQALKQSLNITKLFGGDEQKSAIQLGKALQDPIKGVTALTRVGVSFSAKQKDVIKFMVGTGHTLDAQKLILREVNKEFGGQAVANATAMQKLTVVFKNIEEQIGLFFLPMISKAAELFGTFLNKLANGTGIWGIVRTGLQGIAIGLGAILAVKGAVQVMHLIGVAWEFMSAAFLANPVLFSLGALGIALFVLYKHAKPVRDFFDGLVNGVKAWFLVGFRIKDSIGPLSTLTGIFTRIGAATRSVIDFFKVQIGNLDAVLLFGYRMNKVIVGLGPVAVFVSTLGVVARRLRDSIKVILAALGALLHFNFEAFHNLMFAVFHDLGSAIAPAIDSIKSGLATIQHNIADFFYSFWTGMSHDEGTGVEKFAIALRHGLVDGIKSALNWVADKVSGFVKDLFGRGQRGNVGDAIAHHAMGGGGSGGGKGFAQGLMIGGAKSLLEGVMPASDDQAASESLGTRLHNIIVRAGVAVWTALQGLAATIADFFSGLFHGKYIQTDFSDKGIVEALGIDSESNAKKAGRAIHDWLGKAFHYVKNTIGGLLKDLGVQIGHGFSWVLENLGNFGQFLANWFTKTVLPALIDLPRVLGKFLARTVFSDPFIKGLGAIVLALSGVTALIVIQFVRGFVEGLWSRRGDLGKMLMSLLKFAVEFVFGSGNPFLIIATLLGLAFSAKKILGPLLKGFRDLKVQGHNAWDVLHGDADKAKQRTKDFNVELGKTRKELATIKTKGGFNFIGQKAYEARKFLDAVKLKTGQVMLVSRFAGSVIGAAFVAAYTQAQAAGIVFMRWARGAPLALAQGVKGLIGQIGHDVWDTTKWVARGAKIVATGVYHAVVGSFQAIAAAAGPPLAWLASKASAVLSAIGSTPTWAGIAAAAAIGWKGVQTAASATFTWLNKAAHATAGSVGRALGAIGRSGPWTLLSAAARTAYSKMEKPALAFSNFAIKSMKRVSDASGGFINLPFDKLVKAASTAWSKIKTGASGMFGGAATALGTFVGNVRTSLGTMVTRATGYFASLKKVSIEGLPKGEELDKALAHNNDVMQRRFQAAQNMAQVAGGAIGGYFIGMAHDATTATVSVATSMVNIGIAFAQNPWLGAAVAASTAIGVVFGLMGKASQKAKDAAKAAKEAIQETSGQFQSAFKDTGHDTHAQRIAATTKILQDDIEKTDGTAAKFFTGTGIKFEDMARHLERGGDDWKRYNAQIQRTTVDKVMAGNKAAVKVFTTEASAGFDYLKDHWNKVFGGGGSDVQIEGVGQDVMRELQPIAVMVSNLGKKGGPSIDQVAAALKRTHAPAKLINDILSGTEEAIKKAFKTDPIVTWKNSLLPGQQAALAAIDLVDEYRRKQEEAAEKAKPAFQKIMEAYDRQKAKIQEVIDKVLKLQAARSGDKADKAQGTLDIIGEAETFRGAKGTSLSAQSTRILAQSHALADLNAQLPRIAKESDGTLKGLQAGVQGYIDTLKVNSPKMAGFYQDLVPQITPADLATFVTANQQAIDDTKAVYIKGYQQARGASKAEALASYNTQVWYAKAAGKDVPAALADELAKHPIPPKKIPVRSTPDALTKEFLTPAGRARFAASFAAGAFGAGESFGAGFRNGIFSWTQRVADTAAELGRTGVVHLKGALNVTSPSKVTFGIGQQTAQGFHDGMLDKLSLIQAAGKALGFAAAGGMGSVPQPGGASAKKADLLLAYAAYHPNGAAHKWTGFAKGGVIAQDMVAQLHANEVVLPLNDPDRMWKLMQQTHLDDFAQSREPRSGELNEGLKHLASALDKYGAPVQVNVTEAVSARATAHETVQRVRAAQYLRSGAVR